jgi:hypothetical protein
MSAADILSTRRATPPPLPSKAKSPAPPPICQTEVVTAAIVVVPNSPAAESDAAATQVLETVFSAAWKRLLFWQSVSSWQLSLVLHLIALVGLGLVQWLPQDPQPRETLTVRLGDRTEEIEAYKLEALSTELAASQSLAGEAASLTPSVSGGEVELAEVETLASEIGLGDFTGEGQAFGTLPGNFGKEVTGLPKATAPVEFFGVQATGSRFVFIIDCSTSMGGDKFVLAKQELNNTLANMSPDHEFFVIFFSSGAYPMTRPGRGVAEKTYLPGTKENIRDIQNFVRLSPLVGGTYPLKATQLAATLEPDAVFLLSDGAFSDGGATVDFLARHNLYRDKEGKQRVKFNVHTICFFDRAAAPTLEHIARVHLGGYQFVGP